MVKRKSQRKCWRPLKRRRVSALSCLNGQTTSHQDLESEITEQPERATPLNILSPKIAFAAVKPNRVAVFKGTKCVKKLEYADKTTLSDFGDVRPHEWNDETYNKNAQLIDSVLKKLEKVKKHEQLLTLLQVLESGSLSPDNLSLTLLFETAQWYALQDKQQMTYSKSSLAFWKVGYRLCHGTFLRLMGGEKGAGFDPKDSNINFAVPSVPTITNFKSVSSLPDTIEPGLIEHALEIKAKDQRPQVLSYDGKQLATGLTKNGGDENLFGFEVPSLKERAEKRTQDLATIEQARGECEALKNNSSGNTTGNLTTSIKSVIGVLTDKVKTSREVKVKLDAKLERFIEEAGPEWRKSRLVYAISAVQAYLYQGSKLIEEALQSIESLMNLGRALHESKLAQRLYELKLEDDLPENYVGNTTVTKQRTDTWLKYRETFYVTGSTLHKGIGLQTLKAMQEHYDQHVLKKPVKDIDDEVKKYMDHGTKNEENAIWTLCQNIMPFFYPDLVYCEEGCYAVSSESSGKSMICVSPDGSLRTHFSEDGSRGEAVLACEIKCPYPNKHKPPVHYKIPEYYICQVLAEMVALDVQECIYLSWSSESTTVFRVTFDEACWKMITSETEVLFGSLNLENKSTCKPKRLNAPFRKQLTEKLQTFQTENVELLAEVPSKTYSKSCPKEEVSPTSPYLHVLAEQTDVTMTPQETFNHIEQELVNAVSITERTYQLSRKKATEVIVWMLSDTDREWHPEIPHAVPVAWCMKANSVPVSTIRQMTSVVLKACYDKGICVACTVSDGAYASTVFRSAEGQPLTVLQLAKDVWSNVKKLSRQELTKAIRDTKVEVCHQKNDAKGIECWSLGNSFANMLNNYKFAQNESKTDQADMSGEKCNTDSKERMQDSCIDLQVVFDALQELEAKKWWKTIEDLKSDLSCATRMKALTHAQLNAVIDAISATGKTHHVKKSWTKVNKVNSLCTLIGNGSKLERFVSSKQTLRDQAYLVLTTTWPPDTKPLSKNALNVVHASQRYPSDAAEWASKGCAVPGTYITGVGIHEWFAFAEHNTEAGIYEPKTLDAEHLLVNHRVKVSTSGVDGISPKAWQDVATAFPQVLSKATVFDVLDKQSCARAKEIFHEDVEEKMISLGYSTEAAHCRIVRQWYQAEDDPGLSPQERAGRWMQMRNYLLQGVTLERFPPHGSHIKGYPRIQYEGFLQRIDIKLQLYGFLRQAFNQRAIGTLVNETFFGEISDMEPTKLGCPKAVTMPRLMAHVTELMHFRHNPENRQVKILCTIIGNLCVNGLWGKRT